MRGKMNPQIIEEYNHRPKNWFYYLLIFIVLLAVSIWSTSVVHYHGVSEHGALIAKNIFTGIFHPDTSLMFNLTETGLPYLLLQTFAIGLLGTLVGAIVAIPLSFLAATNLVPNWLAYLIRFVLMAIRTIPSFVYALLFIPVVGLGSSAGVMALGFESIGMIAKLFIEAIEDLDMGVIEAMDAAGATTFQKIRFGVLPQLLPDLYSILLYRLDMNLRDAAILGLVGAGGIGAPLSFAMSGYKWSAVGAILLGLLVLIILVELISSRIRKKLAKG